MNKKLVILVAVVIVIALIFVLSINNFELEQRRYIIGEGSGACKFDDNCVPVGCCHSKTCVNTENASDCSGVYCTQMCEPGTFDCEQGSCKCMGGECKAVFYGGDK